MFFSLQSKNIPVTFLAGLLTNSRRFHLYKNGFVLPFFLKTGSAVYRIWGWQCCCCFGLVTFMYIYACHQLWTFFWPLCFSKKCMPLSRLVSPFDIVPQVTEAWFFFLQSFSSVSFNLDNFYWLSSNFLTVFPIFNLCLLVQWIFHFSYCSF